MAALSTASRLCLRAAAKPAVPAVRALSSTAMRSDGAPSYSSPFKGETKGSQIPDFGKYMSAKSENSNKVFSYFMVGAIGALTAAGAKSTVQGKKFHQPERRMTCLGYTTIDFQAILDPINRQWLSHAPQTRPIGGFN